MADHGGGGGESEALNRPEDRGGPMEAETVEQTAAEPVEAEGAVLSSGGDGRKEPEQKADNGDEGRATEAEPRAMVETGAVEPLSEPEHTGMAVDGSEQAIFSSGSGEGGEDHRATEPEARPTVTIGAVGFSSEALDPNIAVGGFVVTGDNLGDAGSGGAGGDDAEPSQTPLRDSAKGKGAVIEGEQTTEASESPVEIREEDIAFRPPAGAATSSRHVPITYDDIAEHTPDEILARVLESHLEIGEYVLKAKEDRERAIEEAKAAARAEREAERERAAPEGLAADIEAEEAEAEEALGPRVRAVDEAEAIKRPVFSAEAYIPPRPHLFVPSGFAGYKPPQIDYSDELVLRDPGVHVANTWTEVYLLKTPFCTSI
ncbi:hypothetical protein RHMOL_Rhmol10G0203100 [Rhododendron molle]|uniref:Uncharacterized protein n=1 Tax=Rhododendron molle TaxID=49168 RepID=A0ACC0M4C3_RHOML|nr:hypothetical protein RHMOL_Rhmol10G0203100 [Rhododendron molle]